MCRYRRMLVPSLLSLFIGAMAVAALLVGSSACHAGILMTDELSFDAADLDRALCDKDAGAAGSSSQGRNQNEWPPSDNDREHNPIGLLNSTLPTGNSSSSSSTSSSGGAVGSGVVLCLFNSTITLQDDPLLGRLALDHALSLPDPPGNDLLRPPRAES